MNLSISNIAWLPKDRNKIYRFLSKEKIKGIEIAPKLLLHDIKNIFYTGGWNSVLNLFWKNI